MGIAVKHCLFSSLSVKPSLPFSLRYLTYFIPQRRTFFLAGHCRNTYYGRVSLLWGRWIHRNGHAFGQTPGGDRTFLFNYFLVILHFSFMEIHWAELRKNRHIFLPLYLDVTLFSSFDPSFSLLSLLPWARFRVCMVDKNSHHAVLTGHSLVRASHAKQPKTNRFMVLSCGRCSGKEKVGDCERQVEKGRSLLCGFKCRCSKAALFKWHLKAKWMLGEKQMK